MVDIKFPLSTIELKLKELYIDSNKELLKAPLSFDEFKELATFVDVLGEREKLFAKNTKESLGSTMLEVERISVDDEIVVFVNERYNYPVMHNHSFIEMIYVYSGTCTHFLENKNFQLKEGDFCILAPNAMHALAIKDDDAIVINILASINVFNKAFLKLIKGGDLLKDFFENILYNKSVSPYILYATENDEDLKHIILRMIDESSRKQYAYDTSIKLYLEQLFIQIIRKYGMLARVSAAINNFQNENIVAILGYISVNYKNLTLKEVAVFFNYSEAHLCRMLKEYTGKTFGAIIAELQMKRAKELIDEGNLNMTEIGQEVGCFDSSHFNKKFKKIYNISPNEYKKSLN